MQILGPAEQQPRYSRGRNKSSVSRGRTPSNTVRSCDPEPLCKSHIGGDASGWSICEVITERKNTAIAGRITHQLSLCSRIRRLPHPEGLRPHNHNPSPTESYSTTTSDVERLLVTYTTHLQYMILVKLKLFTAAPYASLPSNVLPTEAPPTHSAARRTHSTIPPSTDQMCHLDGTLPPSLPPSMFGPRKLPPSLSLPPYLLSEPGDRIYIHILPFPNLYFAASGFSESQDP